MSAVAKARKVAKAVKVQPQTADKGKATKAAAPVVKATTKGKAQPQTGAAAPATERRYGLDKEQIAELKAEKAKHGYRPGSTYATIIESLIALGINKFHSAADLLAEFARQYDKAKLKEFKQKEKRNEETGLDFKSRILQSAYVTSRSDYGKRCRDLGWETRVKRTDDGQAFGYFKIGSK